MKRRIDFGMFQKVEAAIIIGGGIVAEDLLTSISNKTKLTDVLKLIKESNTVYWVSDGAWSMHELLCGLLNIAGPSEVFISSYAMGETPARLLARLKTDGVIKKLHCLLDNRVDVRTAGSLQLIKGIADKYALIDTHAKVTVIKNDSFSVAVIGSANYTENERYECGVITKNMDVINLQLKWIEHELGG